MRLILAFLISVLALTALGAPTDALAKKGTIHACYAVKGPDKGTMRFVRGKKCHHGERSLKWNKAGQPGQPGAPGQPGTAGPPGPSNAEALDALQAEVDAQSQRIAALENQLAQVSSEFAAFRTLACGQLATLTSQSNALGTAVDAIGLGGTIPPLLTLVNPGAPAALPGFSC